MVAQKRSGAPNEVQYVRADLVDELVKALEEARKALERIRGLDEADGHNLTWGHAAEAVAIAAEALSARETPANA